MKTYLASVTPSIFTELLPYLSEHKIICIRRAEGISGTRDFWISVRVPQDVLDDLVKSHLAVKIAPLWESSMPQDVLYIEELVLDSNAPYHKSVGNRIVVYGPMNREDE